MAVSTAESVVVRDTLEKERRTSLVRRYATRVTICLIIACNAVLLMGIWASGVDLDSLIRPPDVFNPEKDVCVRLAWHRVAGLEEPIRLCSEWINLSDPSGKTHTFQTDTQVKQGADGRLYFDHGSQVDYRLLLYATFTAVVLGLGILVNRYLIARYRKRLETDSGGPPFGIQ